MMIETPFTSIAVDQQQVYETDISVPLLIQLKLSA